MLKTKAKVTVTRFKGLGEISPNEFKDLIGENMKLEPVIIKDDISTEDLLSYYMGKNTQDRQNFIINNLVSDGLKRFRTRIQRLSVCIRDVSKVVH